MVSREIITMRMNKKENAQHFKINKFKLGILPPVHSHPLNRTRPRLRDLQLSRANIHPLPSTIP